MNEDEKNRVLAVKELRDGEPLSDTSILAVNQTYSKLTGLTWEDRHPWERYVFNWCLPKPDISVTGLRGVNKKEVRALKERQVERALFRGRPWYQRYGAYVRIMTGHTISFMYSNLKTFVVKTIDKAWFSFVATFVATGTSFFAGWLFANRAWLLATLSALFGANGG